MHDNNVQVMDRILWEWQFGDAVRRKRGLSEGDWTTHWRSSIQKGKSNKPSLRDSIFLTKLNYITDARNIQLYRYNRCKTSKRE